LFCLFWRGLFSGGEFESWGRRMWETGSGVDFTGETGAGSLLGLWAQAEILDGGGDSWFAAFLDPAGDGGQQLENALARGRWTRRRKAQRITQRRERKLLRRLNERFTWLLVFASAICKPRLQMDPRSVQKNS